MISIKKVTAMEIIDSRGTPTVEATVTLSNDISAIASVPSGASVGKFEAIELRDHDTSRYNGMGVLRAVDNINAQISSKIAGMDILKQGLIDQAMIELDGTVNKGRLGSNAILAVSLAACRAGSDAIKLPLYAYINELIKGTLPTSIEKMPTPTFNIVNGGRHGAGNLDFQEFHVIPASNKPYHDALRMGDEVYLKLKDVLVERNAIHSVGDEGGYAPNLYTNVDALEAIMEAIHNTLYKFGMDIFLGLDLAASQFKKEHAYTIKDKPSSLTTNEFIDYLINLHHDYRLLILEDPLAEDDWDGWKEITQKLVREVIIVGDDLIATNPDRLKKAIEDKACSGVLIKPNQIGTLSEALQVVKIAQQNDIRTIVSHRSGETNDDFIADFAVGVSADYVKFGAPARGERVAKYNRLLHIEKELKLS